MKKKVRKILGGISSLVLLLLSFPFFAANLKPAKVTISPVPEKVATTDSSEPTNSPATLYSVLDLKEAGLSEAAFDLALKGYEALCNLGKVQNTKVLTIIDFTKPSTEKRLFVLDLENLKILYNTYVSHGRNSGKLYAKKFSNRPESHMSSLGFYTTGDTYFGDHGYSLRLKGEEKGINDNAAKRAIVIHSADYADEEFADGQGYLGRSFGCPALPKELSRPIIETIKDGSCLFVYGQANYYTSKSKLL